MTKSGLIEERYIETNTPSDFDEPDPEELTVRVRGERRDDELEHELQEE